MTKVKVITLKPHTPDGLKRYSIGDEYRISLDAAKVLAAMKFVRMDTTPLEITSDAKRYKRRDMRAEE